MARKENWPWKSFADNESSQLGEVLGVSGYPFAIYVNADGSIAARTSGEQTQKIILDNFKIIS